MPSPSGMVMPGAWNFSDLHTTDTGAASTFYASVFGWQTDMLEFGGFKSWLFRLPGYGDFLEQALQAEHQQQVQEADGKNHQPQKPADQW